MSYTQYDSLTNDELILKVGNLTTPTDLELELAERLLNTPLVEHTYDEGYADGYAAGVVKRVTV